MRDMKRHLLNIFILLVILSLSCAKKVPVRVQFPFLTEVTSEAYPNAHGVIILDSIGVVVDTGGEQSRTEHKLIRILTPYGREKFSEATIAYCTAYETTHVLMARVIRPDSIVIDVKKQNIKDLPLPVSGDLNLFLTNVRIKKIIFPQVEIGSVVEWEVKRILKDPPMEGHFSEFVVFADTEPIVSKVYTLQIPAGMFLNYRVRNGVLGFNESALGIDKLYRWEARNVPMILPEPAMSPLPDIATKLLVTTFISWDELSSWYYELADSSCMPDTAIAEKVIELIDDPEDEREKIVPIYEFVNQKIRCIEPELVGVRKIYKPAPAPVTFKNRYGTHEDIAALLVAMLRTIDIDAHIALTSSSITVEDDIPAYQFDRTIVAVKEPSCRYIYLDPCAETPMHFLEPSEQNKKVLICAEEGGKLEATPISSAEDNTFDFEATRLKFGKYLTFRGTLILELKGIFNWLLREEAKQSFLQGEQILLQRIIDPLSKLADSTNFLISRVDDLDTSIAIKIDYEATKHGVETEDRIYFKPIGPELLYMGIPFGAPGSTPWDLPVDGLLCKRDYPISTVSTIGIKGIEVIRIPNEYGVEALPDFVDVDYDDFSYNVCYRYKREESEIESETTLLIRTPLITMDRYPELRAMMGEVDLTGNKVIILRTK
jgi:hypothetical protein